MNELLKQEAQEIETELEGLVIDTNYQLEQANQLAKRCDAKMKEIKGHYKPLKQEKDKEKKVLLESEKSDLKAFENCKDIIKQAILVYTKKQEELRLEELKEQEKEQEEFGFSVTEVSDTPKLQGTHIRKTWKARIVDESKVPMKYGNVVIRTIDMSKLNDIAKFEEGKAIIDGVEFYQEESVVIR